MARLRRLINDGVGRLLDATTVSGKASWFMGGGGRRRIVTVDI